VVAKLHKGIFWGAAYSLLIWVFVIAMLVGCVPLTRSGHQVQIIEAEGGIYGTKAFHDAVDGCITNGGAVYVPMPWWLANDKNRNATLRNQAAAHNADTIIITTSFWRRTGHMYLCHPENLKRVPVHRVRQVPY